MYTALRLQVLLFKSTKGFSLLLQACICLVLPLTFSCSFNPNFQGKGETYLQGEWQQDSVKVQDKLINYSLYHFRFDCDSVYVQIKTVSKVNYGADTCMNKGEWTEYARAVYIQKNDTLHLKGFFCNPDFSLKKPGGCFRSGVYEEHFKIGKKTDSLLEFKNTSGVLPFNIRLIKRTTCNPKPL